MKKIVITCVVIIAALAGIFYVLNKNKAKNEAQTAVVAVKNAAVVVRAAIAEYKDLNIAYTTNGVFAPKQEVIISSETAGKVTSVLVKEGSYVSAGQTLAIIKGDKQNVAVANAKAVYDNAVAEVARFESAYQSGGVTKQQLDQVKLQAATSKNNLANANISATDVNVKASFSGIVNKRSVEPGSYVNPGQQMFEVVNVGTLKLKINVDEKTVGTLKMGQNVTVESSVVPDDKFNGVITFIAPKADASLNFPVELEIKNNSNNGLKAGMYGTATFGANQNSSVFVVPRNAFVGNVSSNKVFVIKDGKAFMKDVVAGRNFGDYVEVKSGLENGEQVVISGQINLSEATPIQIIK